MYNYIYIYIVEEDTTHHNWKISLCWNCLTYCLGCSFSILSSCARCLDIHLQPRINNMVMVSFYGLTLWFHIPHPPLATLGIAVPILPPERISGGWACGSHRSSHECLCLCPKSQAERRRMLEGQSGRFFCCGQSEVGHWDFRRSILQSIKIHWWLSIDFVWCSS